MRAKLTHPIAVARVAHKMTQKQLAQAVSCSPSTIQAIELGRLKPSQKLTERIQRYFDRFDLSVNEWL